MGACMLMGSEKYDIPSGISIGEAIRSLGHTPDEFVFVVNGRPVPVDLMTEDGIAITAVRVASGG